MTPALKWVIALLSLSLMVNVFAIGHVVGSRGEDASPSADVSEASVNKFVSRFLPLDVRRGMPGPARQAFRRTMLENRAAIRASLQDFRRARRVLPELLLEDTVDEADLKAAYAVSRDATAALQSHFEAALSAALLAMSPDERKALAGRLRDRRKKGLLQRGRGDAVDRPLRDAAQRFQGRERQPMGESERPAQP
ncbi:MAG: periplasmic heavy metal sensor [Pseudomonadota bacterium]